jgi:hypothetical protein
MVENLRLSHCARNRLVLNYKGLPFQTKFIEYTEIESQLAPFGAKVNPKKADGFPHWQYTLPGAFLVTYFLLFNRNVGSLSTANCSHR